MTKSEAAKPDANPQSRLGMPPPRSADEAKRQRAVVRALDKLIKAGVWNDAPDASQGRR